MNRDRLKWLIDQIESNNPLDFDFRIIYNKGYGCAAGTYLKLTGRISTDDNIRSSVDGRNGSLFSWFDLIEDELNLTSNQFDVLFDWPSRAFIESNKGFLRGFGYREDGTTLERPPIREEWVAHARKFLEITE